MNILFDVELFFIFLANSIVEYPNLLVVFNNYFKADKLRFYERATRSKYYDPCNMSSKTIELEEAMRRVFGILLCAEEDESCRDFVCGELINTDRRLAELVKNPNKAAINTFAADMIDKMNLMPDSYDAKNAPMFFLAYLFYTAYGVDGNNQIVNDFLSHTHKLILDMSKKKTYYSTKMSQKPKMNGIAIPKESQALIRQLKTGLDLASLTDFYHDDTNNADPQLVKPELYSFMKNYSNLGSVESRDMHSAMAIVQMAVVLTNIVGTDLDGLYGTISITKDEQNMIIKMLADMNPQATAAELRQQINLTNYVVGHIFMLLSKEIRNTREYFFMNNNETQYLEHQRLQAVVDEKTLEIERLKVELAKSNEQGERQKEEIQRLTDEAFKENKDAIKPYAAEISGLNSRIRELENALVTEQAKTPELNALREFAFEARTEYIPPETTVTLAELTQGKKIIIVGGHVNWRNIMKERYPTITFIDGHNASLDNSIFDKASCTLFYTSNMSHKVYEKIICYLRDRTLRFGFLGRRFNHELLEAEIVSVLQDKM